MRPTGSLHLGNYHGALKNWTELQYQYDCYFFIADYHALTTGYDVRAHVEPVAVGVECGASTVHLVVGAFGLCHSGGELVSSSQTAHGRCRGCRSSPTA